MTTIDLGTAKFGSEYPLPGGVENYFDTLLALLRFVRDHDVTSDGLADWFNITTGATGQVAVSGYISSLGRLGFWTHQDEKIKLSQFGITVVTSADEDLESASKLVVGQKCKRIAGYDYLFELLASGDQSTESMHAALQSALSVDWKTKNQTTFRVNWLRSLGCAEKEGKLFRLTMQGKTIYQELFGSAPVEKQNTGGGEVAHTANALEKQAIKIADALKQCSTAGGDGKEFEEATEVAFAFLGFKTQLISGSGNPDVLATAPMGEKSYRVLIDSKSRTSGIIQQNDVPYPALQKQKLSANADYIVVVGPGFAGGQLAEFAQQQKIRLMTTDDLRDLMLAHAKSAFPLDLLKPLFEGGGTLDEGVLSTVQSSAESSGEMMELAGKVFIAINEHQGKAGAINCDSLFYILNGAHEIPVIKMVIDFLRCDLIGALGQASSGSLHTRLSPQSLEQKLAQVADSFSLGHIPKSLK